MSFAIPSRLVSFVLTSFMLICMKDLMGQSYHAIVGGLETYELEITNHNTCVFNYIGPSGTVLGCAGFTRTPDSLLIMDCYTYPVSPDGFKEIDQMTGWFSPYFDWDPGPNIAITGIASVGNGIFYALRYVWTNTTSGIYRIDVNAGTVIYLGDVPYVSACEMTLFNGELYYPWMSPLYYLKGIVKVNTVDPSASELVVTFPENLKIRALTASDICNTLLACTTGNNRLLYYINLIDGVITPVCQPDYDVFNITSLIEFESPTTCPVLLDLDEDDSSGLPNADYTSAAFDCHSGGVPVSDQDITMFYDALVTEMTIQITGFIPDAPNEILETPGTAANIDVIGNGTDMITLINMGGAKSTDFKDALREIRYNNISVHPTGGERTVEVRFTTESGAMSNMATAFIQVNELPSTPVDLGEDLELCDGESVTLDAGINGTTYIWSNGATSQTITVDQSGIYSVTVTDNIHCPGDDEVIVDIIPLIHVSLSGDIEVCDNVNANISIITDSTIPVNVEISTSSGSVFYFTGVSGTFTFIDSPGELTEYSITNIEPGQNACIELVDSTHTIDVYPSYIHFFDIGLCNGDSVWLGYNWESSGGVYENTFHTFEGCDSIVTTTITLVSTVNLTEFEFSCDSSEVGSFITHLQNPDGCDTILTTIVSLISADTTFVTSTTCNSGNTGVFISVMPDQMGCDSIIITTVTLDSPTDTTKIYHTTCDLSQIGTVSQLLTNQSGCDSLVITLTSAEFPDSIYLLTASCDSASLGVFENHFVTTSGCDSIVFTTVTYTINDYTELLTSSCDPNDIGIFADTLTNRFGCDSIISTTVSLAITDEIFLTSSSCNPSDTGVFVRQLTNQFGCDSIVTETISLLPENNTFISSSTCIPSEAGTFINIYQNQFGCDSTVTLSVALVPADTTIIIQKTCDAGQVGSIESHFINVDGCDSLVITQITLYPLPAVEIEVVSDYNGSPISCYGVSDGSLKANVPGPEPLDYLWSNSLTTKTISGLSTGTYLVTITDSNGCSAENEITISEPENLSSALIISEPDCFGDQEGSITVNAEGGVKPYLYSIDGVNYQSENSFTNLAEGTYSLSILDANDCEMNEIIWINVPLKVNVELGADMQIQIGDSAVLQALMDVPYDSLSQVSWSGLDNAPCPLCLNQVVTPIITTSYSITVLTNEGCSDEDEVTVFVEKGDDIFIPNVFSPNGDNVNDVLMISASSSIKNITSMAIFDRWGNIVFQKKDFPPNYPSYGWDGKVEDQLLNPGVYVYKLMFKLKDGSSEIRNGSITLIR